MSDYVGRSSATSIERFLDTRSAVFIKQPDNIKQMIRFWMS